MARPCSTDIRPERLEQRTLLSSALLQDYSADSLPSDLVFDDDRAVLYAVHEHSVARYDVRAGEWKSAWEFGSSLRDADISPDGEFLYVTDTASFEAKAVVHRVDLDSGNVTQLDYDAPGETGTGVVNVTADNKLLVVGSSSILRSLDPATGNIVTLGGPAGPSDTVRGPFIRSADRGTILTGFQSTEPFALYDVDGRDVLGSRLFGSGYRTLVSPDVRVVGPGGQSLPIQLTDLQIPTDPADKSVRATYDVQAPDGTWDYTENGSYEVVVNGAAVADAAGNALAGPTTRQFTVDIPQPPPPPPPIPPGPKPDVVVDSVRVKGRHFRSGATITASVVVRNDGDAPLQSARIDAFARPDFGDVIVAIAGGSVDRDFMLPPGKTARFTVQLAASHGYDPQLYVLRVTVTPLVDFEVNDENNQAESDWFDIRPVGGTVVPLLPEAPVSLTPGQRVTARFRAYNPDDFSSIAANYAMEVVASTGGSVLDSVGTVLNVVRPLSIKPKGHSSFTLRFTVPSTIPAGSYFLLLDPRVVQVPEEPIFSALVIR